MISNKNKKILIITIRNRVDDVNEYDIYLLTPTWLYPTNKEKIMSTTSFTTLMEFVRFYGLYNTTIDDLGTDTKVKAELNK